MRGILLLFLLNTGAYAQQAPRHFLGDPAAPVPSPGTAPEEIARTHLRSIAHELGLSAADLNSVYLAKQYRTSQNGVTHIVFRQRFQDAEVWNAEWAVNIDRDGRVLNAGGNLFDGPVRGLAVPVREHAESAVRVAVAAVNPALQGRFNPTESTQTARMRNGIRFDRGPLARDVEGAAVWYRSGDRLLPAWNFYIADSDFVHRYSVTVDDASHQILQQQALTFFQSASGSKVPSGLVFTGESPQPNPTPGVRLTGPPPIVPRVTMPFQGNATASPHGWVSGGATSGNNVIVGENLAGAAFITPVPTQSASGDFSFPLQLDTGFFPLAYPDAAITNLFYWMNRAHDLHYQYGFDEQAGNYQTDNFGRGGTGGDPIFAYAHYGSQSVGAGQFENSFFSLDGTTDDGVPAEVSMFISGGLGPAGDLFTDGSYDSEVMIHEYTHGVSSRLARQAYSVFQGQAMGEAWSDFYALEYTIPAGAPPNGSYPAAEYFNQSWGVGIRTRPYSTDLNIDPLTLGNMGHVMEYPEIHADGEIWVAALWEIRANLIAQFGEQEGRERVRRLVMDGMKLAIPAATMVDMRDAILLADRVDYQGSSQSQLWAGFAKRGLGALAFAQDGTTVHVVQSFDLPSTTGQLKFYDNSVVAGETVRVVLQDSNLTPASVLIQLTGSSGDLENVILHQRGSIYTGSIGTALTAVGQQNGRLELASGDAVSAYYNDFDTGSGGTKLVQITMPVLLPYTLATAPNTFTFSGERSYTIGSGWLDYQLPFTFPFFDKKYGAVKVFRNGLIAFDLPASPGTCADSTNLTHYSAVTPLWTASGATTFNGLAQSGEGLFISTTAKSATFRWASEYTALDDTPQPINIAATLYDDGRILFQYGSGNVTVDSPASFSSCGPTILGIGNGHDTYAQTFASNTFQKLVNVRLDPPFNDSSLPSATITAPAPGDHVQDILKVTGTASDSAATVLYVDVYIDGIARAHVAPGTVNQAWSATLNLAGIGVGAGSHTLKIRATNSRGGFTDAPDAPLQFTVDSGHAFLPVISIDQPSDGATIKGNLVVRGSAYDTGLVVSSVDTLIDGFVYAGTAYNLSRTDVCNSLNPKPANCPNVGFSGTFDTVEGAPPIPDGTHTLQVRVRDQTGRFTLYPDTPLHITVSNGAAAPVVGVLEAPAANATLTGTVTVSGYMYSSGQNVIGGYLLIDGQVYGTLFFAGGARPDVCPSLPNADACPNIGFSIKLDTTKLPNGPHTMGIEGFNSRGDYAVFPQVVRFGINVTVEN